MPSPCIHLPRVAKVMASLQLLLLVSVTSAAAADDVDRLRSQIEKDQSAFSRVVKQVNDAPLNTRSETSALAGSLDNAASEFEASAQNYRQIAKSASVAGIANLGAQGTAEMAAGARAAATALRSGDGAGFQTAQGRVNRGRQTLSQTVDQYNAYIKAHPSSSSFLGDLGESPLDLTLALSPFVIGISIYLLIAGFVLNRLFGSRLSGVTNGSGRARLRSGMLAHVYGLHLIMLVALGYLTLAFAAVLVIDFGLVAAAGVSQARRIPVMLVVALAAIVLASLWGILRGLFGSTRTANYGIDVGPRDEPGLWHLSQDTARAAGTRPADAIVVSPLPGVSVHEEGGLLQLLVGRTHRVLTVGAPSILGLTVQQFQAILGHEYGHFSNRDTAWSSLTYRAGSAVSQTLETMQSVGARGGWFGLVSLVNPARWALWIYRLLFAYVTSGFSRMREVFADQAAVEQYGSGPFKSGLKGVVVNDRLFGGAVMPRMFELARDGRYFSNLYFAAEDARRSLAPDEIDRLFGEAALQKPSAFDSHPALRDRLTYADRFAVAASPGVSVHGTEPLVEQFVDWQKRSSQLSDLLAHSLFAANQPTAVPAD